MKQTLRQAARLALYVIVAGLALAGLHSLLFPSPACAQTAAEMRTMERVNSRVNLHIEPIRQNDGFDTARVLPAEGDCDDYAYSKFMLLMAEGFAPHRLRLATVGFRHDWHAVLVVDGRWVLDNLERRIVPVETARRYYRF